MMTLLDLTGLKCPLPALKTRKSLGIVCERFGQDLDRHIAPEFGVVRSIYFSHPARANAGEDFIGP